MFLWGIGKVKPGSLPAMTRVLLNILPFFYAALVVGYGYLFFRPTEKCRKPLRVALVVTLLAHLAYLVLLGIDYAQIPITSMGELMSLLALALAVVYLLIEWRMGIPSTGVFILLAAFAFQIISRATTNVSATPEDIVLNPIAGIHAVAAAFGYGAFIIAALYGLLYLLLFHIIRARKYGLFFDRMPSLEELDDMNFRASGIGFALMTFSIALGAYYMALVLEDHSPFDAKIIVALTTWAIFGANIVLKKWLGRSGLVTSYLSLLGFVLILFSMLVVDAIFSTFHIFN